MASSLSLPVSPVVAHVTEYASTTACLDFNATYGMDKLVETCKLFMKNKAMGFVKKADGRALLASYGSDGTPLITRQQWRHTAGSMGSVRRPGGSSHEYLIQRCFFMYHKSGEAVVDTLFTEPIPLASGKDTVQLFNWARVFSPRSEALAIRACLCNTCVSIAVATARLAACSESFTRCSTSLGIFPSATTARELSLRPQTGLCPRRAAITIATTR